MLQSKHCMSIHIFNLYCLKKNNNDDDNDDNKLYIYINRLKI